MNVVCIFKKKEKKNNDQGVVKKNKPDVVVIREPAKNACGGTTETLDRNAPKDIESHNIVYFLVESALGRQVNKDGSVNQPDFSFVSAFATPSDKGTFIFYENNERFGRHRNRNGSWVFIKDNMSGKLDALVRECDLIKNNGHNSATHGLPDNFGGSVLIEYDSGETISFSNNQSPIIDCSTGIKIDKLFREMMGSKQVKLPPVDSLRQILFEEDRGDDGYTRACLTINDDGTATNRKEAKYSDPNVFQSEKPVDAETVAAIKENINKTGIFAWPVLTDSSYSFTRDQVITFKFDGADDITVTNSKRAPADLHNGFFNIVLEMTTKH